MVLKLLLKLHVCEHKECSTFQVRCIGYKLPYVERFFTLGQEYQVCEGRITNDNGFTYEKDPFMYLGSDMSKWYLSVWYKFEIVEDDVKIPDCLDISFEEVLRFEYK